MIEAKLKLLTGLHIGGGDDAMKIGGVDSPVIKRDIFVNDKRDDKSYGKVDFNSSRKITEPYIPASSLKGKIRSLLEHHLGLIQKQKEIFNDERKNGNPIDSNFIKELNESDTELIKRAKLIIKLFGESGGNKNSDSTTIRVTRGIFRDSFITIDVRKKFLSEVLEFSEIKYENVIDRVSGTTKQGGLRQVERVPAGVEFDFRVDIRKFSEDENLPLLETLVLGIKLLEMDTLGGSGSRGYGRVEFEFNSESELYSKSSKELLEIIESKLNETS